MALNKVILQGNLCKDVQLSQTNNGGTYLRNTVAVSRNYVREGEERQSDFVSILAYGKTSEFISKYFAKGSKVLIEGEIRTGSYDKEDGTKVYTTDVIVSNIYFVESKKQQEEKQSDLAFESQFAGTTMIDDELPF